MKVDAQRLIVYLPDTRGTTISRYGSGNLKIGLNVFTYSRLPGLPTEPALGTEGQYLTSRADVLPGGAYHVRGYEGTCPGATEECRAVCYAARPVAENGPVNDMWWRNSITEAVPTELPAGCTLLRLHISGDFTTREYINGWTELISRHPDVTVWAYTRSWRVPSLLPALERLRALPNVQLFASIDKSTEELPPATCRTCGMEEANTQHLAACPDDAGAHDFLPAPPWRRAWIDGDPRAGEILSVLGHSELAETFDRFATQRTEDGVKALICPEETKAVANCEECGFCFRGQRNDVIFLLH